MALIKQFCDEEIQMQNYEDFACQLKSRSRKNNFQNIAYIFDFDGVIADQFDDLIYKMNVRENEIKEIETIRKKIKINCSDYDINYQRHLIYQSIALNLSIEIDKGPAFPAVEFAEEHDIPYFILTARSGYYANKRLYNFLYSNNLNPVEIFSVGRVKKNLQIEYINQYFSGKTLFYFEDNYKHAANAASLRLPCVKVVFVDSAEEAIDQNVRERYTEIVKLFLRD